MTEMTDWEKFTHNPLRAKMVVGDLCGVRGCREVQWQQSPVCQDHALYIRAAVNHHESLKEEMAEAERQFEEMIAKKEAMFHERVYDSFMRLEPKPKESTPGHIYYLQVGSHIKIGFTTNLQHRLTDYPPSSRLLAKHPGTIQTERHILGMFKDDLDLGREWFRPSAKLTEHIEEVVTKYHT